MPPPPRHLLNLLGTVYGRSLKNGAELQKGPLDSGSAPKSRVKSAIRPRGRPLPFYPRLPSIYFLLFRRIYVGAAACDPEIVHQVREKLGVETVQSLNHSMFIPFSVFGMTEAGLALLLTPIGCTREDTVGLPIPGVIAKVTVHFLLGERGKLPF